MVEYETQELREHIAWGPISLVSSVLGSDPFLEWMCQ